MKVYVARQPIFDINHELFAYELLYRNNANNSYDTSMEGNRATRMLLSDVLTVFQLDNITNQKYAFVNFTKDLLLDKVPKVLDSKDIVIEILEDVIPDEELIECVIELKERDFKIALDDYSGPGPIDALLKYADIIKVDFSLVKGENRIAIAKDLLLREPGLKLLAEKVEDETDMEQARAGGYTLFQGYYFSKPMVLTSSYLEIADTTGMRLFGEINKTNPSYDKIVDIIRVDVGMAYTVFKQMNTLTYYRGNKITDIKDALVRMGISEIRRITMLIMMRNFSSENSSEVAKTALARGVFAESIVGEVGWEPLKERAFFAGMFSMIDIMLNEDMMRILAQVCIFDDVREALMGSDNELKHVLMFIRLYEEGHFEEAKEALGIGFNVQRMADYYIQSITYADRIFNSLDW